MKKVVMLALAAVLCGGCSAFRAMFDEDPAVTQQKRERAKQRREERARSGGGDDVFPAFFSGSKRSDSLYVSSSLTPEERAVLEGTEAASKRRNSAESEVESILSADTLAIRR